MFTVLTILTVTALPLQKTFFRKEKDAYNKCRSWLSPKQITIKHGKTNGIR